MANIEHSQERVNIEKDHRPKRAKLAFQVEDIEDATMESNLFIFTSAVRRWQGSYTDQPIVVSLENIK